MIFLCGGGRGSDLGPFLAALPPRPTILCAYLGDDPSGWIDLLTGTVVPLDLAGGFALRAADAIFVAGGLTPAYADALVPHAAELRAWLAEGRAYAGFSAGAVIAADAALVGGWRHDGVPVCDPDTAEDLDELTVRPGLGLVPTTIEVHAAQWGTLNRLVTAVHRGLVPTGLAVDEDTLLAVAGRHATVHGRGQVHRVRPTGAEVGILPLVAGTRFEV